MILLILAVSESSSDIVDKIALADAKLEQALRLLDDARRYDVSAHVDLALHILRGTMSQSQSTEPDMIA
jgi:hypothetical protein